MENHTLCSWDLVDDDNQLAPSVTEVHVANGRGPQFSLHCIHLLTAGTSAGSPDQGKSGG